MQCEHLEARDLMTGQVIISEVNPTGSAASYAADWYEVTNTGTTAIDISGWRFDDGSSSFASAVALRGITSIPAGRSAIFLEGAATGTNDEMLIANFSQAWFGTTEVPAGILIGAYGGTGVGLSSTADAVNLFNAAGALQAKVTFGASTLGVSFDNAQGLDNTAITQLSSLGTNGAYRSLATLSETGSPGRITAATNTVDLSSYVRVGRYDLPEPTRTTPPNSTNRLAQESSAVTYNWDTDTLFLLGDGGTAIVQTDKTGQLIDTMTLATGSSPQGTEFYDPEGLAYVGNGKFVLMEERDRQFVRFDYVAGTTLSRSAAETVKIGTSIGNIGIEGISYDPMTLGFIAVKETSPQGIFQTGIDFIAGTATNGSPTTANSTDLFDPNLLELADLADVYSLSNVPYFNGFSDYGNILVLSQETGSIVETDRSGNVLSRLTIMTDNGNPLSVADQQHEGMVMDWQGNLYVVSENGGGSIDYPQLWVYQKSSTPNQAPTAVQITNGLSSLSEATSTANRVKVADIFVTDDGLGTNNLTVTGADAASFEIINSSLYIKAGTALNALTKGSYTVAVAVDDPTLGSTPDATSADYTIAITPSGTGGGLRITEVASWSSSQGTVGADWFEVTNTSGQAINITGWKMDDNSNNFSVAVTLNGITSIAPGESVIFLETASSSTVTAFLSAWYGSEVPAGLQVGTYSGSSVGLSSGGDTVNLFNSFGTRMSSLAFGAASGSAPFFTFDNSAAADNATINTLSVVGVHGAFVAMNDVHAIGSPGTVGKLFVSEIAPWSSGNSPVAADWFELTNTTAFPISLTGWKVDDSSASFSLAGSLSGVNSIAPGESVVFVETAALATTRASFLSTWFGSNPPASLQIGGYSGTGLGLGTGGDAVNIYDTDGLLRASVSFGAATTTAPFRSFDNAAALNATNISTFSTSGVNGAREAVNSINEIASPGVIAAVNPFGPTIREITPSPYLNLPEQGSGYLSGVVNDPSDIARVSGIDFTFADPDTDVSSLSVSVSSSNLTVVSAGGLTLTGSGATRNLRITPTDVGYSTITLSVSDGVSTTTYSISYAASVASTTPTATRYHTGSSDASAAVAIDASFSLVADDEDQVLRLYQRQQSGLPVASYDFSTSLGLTDTSGGVPREVDLEAALRSGNRVYWIGSASNSSTGASRPNRNRIFATDLSGSGAATTIAYVGRYDFLKEDLIAWDQTNAHGLGADYYGLAASAAIGIAPEAASGFNIEGVVWAPGSSTTAFIAFRAPLANTVSRSRALLVPVTNFSQLAISDGAQGSALFGAPIELNLGGRGVRDLVGNGTEIVIIAGPADATDNFALYSWSGAAGEQPIRRDTNLSGLNPEAIVEVPGGLAAASVLQLLSDNGNTVWYNDGVIAKDLPHDEQTKFRSDLVSLGRRVTALTVSQAAATVGGSTTLQASLSFVDAGSAVAGKAIEFRLQGSLLGTSTTDANGIAKLTVNLAAYSPGLLTNGLQASFVGDSETTAASGSANLIITDNYLQPTVPNVSFMPILSVGDNASESINYRMVGIPDGLGALDNGDGTFSVLMNHELSSSTTVRAHGGTGAFVSKWTFNKSTLAAVSGTDLITQLRSGDPTTGFALLSGSSLNLSRLCAADLAPISSFYNAATGKGTTDRLFMAGEESSTGRAIAAVVNGSSAGTAYTLPNFGSYNWENLLANPGTGDTTLVIGTDDGNLATSKVITYVGTKQSTGNSIERAGLTNGTAFQIQAAVNGIPVTAEDRNNALAGSTGSPIHQGTFSLVTSGGTGFNRAEDGAWDPRDPRVFYFVTTDQITSGNRNSRLWKLTFSDLSNPQAGGTIEVLINGKDTALMFDNLGVDQQGRLFLQEDPGNNSRLAQIWMYDTASGALLSIGQHHPSYFLNGVDPSKFLTQDEESSGIIDMSSILGDGAYLVNVQAHYAINSSNPRGFSNPAELIQGGQLSIMRVGATAGLGFTATNSAGPTALATSPAIVIAGTNQADQFKVSATGNSYNVRLNAASLITLNMTAGQILASGYGGNDGIDLSATQINSRIYGGPGNDQLRGGGAVDIIFGEAGNDALFGNASNDQLYGGAGSDSLNGGAGADRLQGDSGGDSFLYDLLDALADFLMNENDRKLRVG
jgi:uncharacterized protein YjiK